jgi:transposase
MHRHVLSDREWNLLAPLLPQRAQTGRPPNDHRTIIDVLLWLAKTGAPWRDLPERFGPWRTVATRFYRWTHSGFGNAFSPSCGGSQTPRAASTGRCT